MDKSYFSSRDQRLKYVPSEDSGRWVGDRGNSLCQAKSEECRRILSEKGLDGIEYKDGIPDFSPLSRSTVQIARMSGARNSKGVEYRDSKDTLYSHIDDKGVETVSHKADRGRMSDLFSKYNDPGNFDQADILTAQAWSADDPDGKKWTADDVASYRQANGLTWHEDNDGETMMLVPAEINADFDHFGGVAEMKIRESILNDVMEQEGPDADDSEMDELSKMSDDEIAAYFDKKHIEQDQYEAEQMKEDKPSIDALGIYELQRTNAKTYKPPMTEDGYVEHDGFVPDDTQIMLDQAESQEEREALEAALDAPIDDDDSYPVVDVYTPEERAEINALDEAMDGNEPEINWDVHTVPTGTRLSRYTNRIVDSDNKDGGHFFTTAGTDRSEVSLQNADQYQYLTEYEVLKPFDAETGVASAAYGEQGGGDQVVPTDQKTVSWLEENGYIAKVGRSVQDSDGNWVETPLDPEKNYGILKETLPAQEANTPEEVIEPTEMDELNAPNDIDKPAEADEPDTLEEVEEPAEPDEPDTSEAVEEPAEADEPDTLKEVEEPTETDELDTLEEAEEPAEAEEADTLEEVEEPTETDELDTLEEAEEPAEPDEPDTSEAVEEPAEAEEADTLEEVEEPAETDEFDTLEEVEEPAENVSDSIEELAEADESMIDNAGEGLIVDVSSNVEIPSMDFSDETADVDEVLPETDNSDTTALDETYVQESMFGNPVDYSDSVDQTEIAGSCDVIDTFNDTTYFSDGSEQICLDEPVDVSIDDGGME